MVKKSSKKEIDEKGMTQTVREPSEKPKFDNHDDKTEEESDERVDDKACS